MRIIGRFVVVYKSYSVPVSTLFVDMIYLFLIIIVSFYIDAVFSLKDIVEWKTHEHFCGNNSDFFKPFVTCNSSSVILNPSFCLTLRVQDGRNKFFFGKCPLVHLHNSNRFRLPSNISNISTFNEQIMCKQVNRTGVLCGQCIDSSGVFLDSVFFKCIPDEHCHGYNWLFFIMAHLAPVTVLFILVIVFDIKLTSGYAYSYILFSQVITNQQTNRINATGLAHATRTPLTIFYEFLMAFYSIWSLNLGQVFSNKLCTSKSIDTMDAIALQYISPYYIFLLIFLMHCLISLLSYKDFVILRYCKWSVCTSFIQTRLIKESSTILINAFATFFLLSCLKLSTTSLLLLCPTYLYNAETGKPFTTVYLYDGTVNYFGNAKVILLNLFAIFTLIVFIILPSFLLLFYPMRRFRRVLEYLKLDRPGLVTFVNSFQECYKDGTNGTRDCRWFSAVYFLLRIVLSTVYLLLDGVLHNHNTLMVLFQGLIMLALLVVAIVYPYKRQLYNQLDIALLLLSVFIVSLSIVNSFLYETGDARILEILLMISFFIPFIGAVLYIGYHTVMKLIVCTRLSVKAWYNMRRVQNRSDDIDSFVQDKATVSQDLTTDNTDLTPSLPDRLIRPSFYSEQDHFVHVNYGSMNQDH